MADLSVLYLRSRSKAPITDTKFVFRTKRFTLGLIDIRLGRDCFDKASGPFRPTPVSIGQKEQRYVEVCDGPTTFRSHEAVLGYTDLGFGNLDVEGELPWPAKVVGEKTTVNSLAIARPFGELPSEALLGWQEVQAVPLGGR